MIPMLDPTHGDGAALGANPTAFDFGLADDMDRLEHLANGEGA